MLYLYIYKGGYEMNTYKFQHDIGGTASCMNIIMKANKGYGKISSNNNLFDYGWLSGVKKTEEENAEVLYHFWPLSTSHKGFLLAKLL